MAKDQFGHPDLVGGGQTDLHSHSIAFLDHVDTPQDYTGAEGKFVKVNVGPDGLIFASLAAGDLPAHSHARADISDFWGEPFWANIPDKPLIVEGGFGPSILDPDCVLYLPMIEGRGVIVYDKSGKGNDGTLYPTPVPISACDTLTDWTASAGGSLSIDTEDKREGIGSLKNTVAEPEEYAFYDIQFEPAGTWDLSAKKHILFELICDRVDTDFLVAYVSFYDALGKYMGWDITFPAGEWKAFKFLISSGEGDGPDLAALTKFEVAFMTVDTTPFYFKVDNIRIDDGPQWGHSEISGQCLDLEGEDDHVKVSSNSMISETEGFISLRAKFNELDRDQIILISGEDDADGESGKDKIVIKLRAADNKIVAGWETAAEQQYAVSDDAVVIDTEYHLVLRWSLDPSEVRLFVDAVEQASGDVFTGNVKTNWVDELRIGRAMSAGANANALNGLVNEIRISQQALTDEATKLLSRQVYLMGVGLEQDLSQRASPAWVTASLTGIKSGATQVAAGAEAGELWKTASHSTLPDNVVMIGV